MRDKIRPLSLLVALSTFLLCQASQVRDVRPSPQEEQPKTSLPIDILGLQANEDVTVMFGLRLFNDIHTRMAQCREERNKIEAKYTNQSKRMRQYYDETERVIAKTRAQFERLVHENSEAVEANFEKAFRELERSRDRKLKRLEARCSNIMTSFLEARMKEAVAYANSLMEQDPVAFTRLTFDASTYANQLRAMLPMCSHGNRPHLPPTEGTANPDSHGEMNFDLCYVSEIRQIISFIDHFLAQADELRQQYFGDDEDFYDAIDNIKESSSGDFPEEDDFDPQLDNKVTPTQTPATDAHPTTVYKKVPISGLLEPGPVIFKPEDEEHHNGDDKEKKPTPTEDTPLEKPSPVDSTSPVVPIDELLEPGLVKVETTPLPTKETLPSKEPVKPIEHRPPKPDEEKSTDDHPPKPDEEEESNYDSDEKKKATKSLDKEEPTVVDSKPTHEKPPWLDDAFDDIIGPMADDQNKEEEEEEGNEPSDLDEKDLWIPARSRSKSKSEDNGNIGVDVEVGPNGVNIEANIGQQGGGPSLNIGGSIIFDDDPEFTTAGSAEDEDNSFITYMLIYFFATLGSLLLLTILVLGIAIVTLRLRSGRTPKDTPLLSEEEKIAVMKQTGYVNPTYKFFDSSVKDV